MLNKNLGLLAKKDAKYKFLHKVNAAQAKKDEAADSAESKNNNLGVQISTDKGQ